MRPDHFVRWPTVVPTLAELKVVFLAALKLVQPKLEVKADLAAAGRASTSSVLRKLVPPQTLEQLGVVVQRFVASKGEADLNKWSNAVDLHGHARRLPHLQRPRRGRAPGPDRAGLRSGVADPKDKIRDLLLWSISDEYFVVREHLGLVIGQG